MRQWTRSEKLTAIGILVAILAIVFAIVNPEARVFLHLDPPRTVSTAQLPAAQPASPPQPAAPVQKPKLTGVFATNLEALRRTNKVERIADSESGMTVSELPAGSFGFASATDFTMGPPEKIELEPSGYDAIFEVHKTSDRGVEIVVYVGAETLERLHTGVESGEILHLYSWSWKEAPSVVAVPVEGIKCQRWRLVTIPNPGKKYLTHLKVLDCTAK